MTLTSPQNPPHVYSNRTVILARKKQNDRLHVLVSEKPSVHLPLCQINPMCSLYLTLASFLKEIFEAWLFPNEVMCFRIDHSCKNKCPMFDHQLYTSANLSRLPSNEKKQETRPSSHGILSVEHTGHPTNSNDGCCLTLLMSIKVGTVS